jgi:hypothetical protein
LKHPVYIITSYHNISYCITYHILSYHTISYYIIYIVSYHIIYHIISYHIIYHIIPYRIISCHIKIYSESDIRENLQESIFRECRYVLHHVVYWQRFSIRTTHMFNVMFYIITEHKHNVSEAHATVLCSASIRSFLRINLHGRSPKGPSSAATVCSPKNT